MPYCLVVPSRVTRQFSAIVRPGRQAFTAATTAICSEFLLFRGRYGSVIAAELLLRSFLHSLLPLAFLCPQ